MLCVRWNFEGAIRWKLVPNGRPVYVDRSSQELERVHEILKRRYSALVNRSTVILQHNNVRPYTARTTTKKIQELGGIKLGQHPAYSPDLSLQITICFDPSLISCVEEISKTF